MRLPTLTWVGYNVIRLSALVFLVWGIAAQFIALANDLKEYSATKNSSSSSSLAVPSLSIQNASTTTTNDDVPLVSADQATPTPTPTSTLVTAEEVTPTLTSSETLIVATDTETTPVKTPLAIAGTIPENEAARIWKHVKRDDSESGGYYGSSAIPRQAGGALFVVLSRFIFVVAMSLLCLGQLGWPEQWLYDNMPWFGAASTPIWIGTGETVVGILNLAIHAESAVLIPAWCIAVVGLLNILSSAVLLFLARRLPKNPPPAMYFHLATRFLYWTKPPGFYRRLSDPDETAQPQRQVDELEKGISHRSNAAELGLDDDDDDADDEGEVEDVRGGIQEGRRPHETPQPIPRMQIRHDPLPEQDVRNGGYPTSSGRGMTDPATQVPKGVLDVDRMGRIKGFVREDARRKERDRIVEMMKRDKADSQREKADTQRTTSRGEQVTRSAQEKSTQTVKLARPPSRTDRASRAISSIPTDPPPIAIPKASPSPSQPLLPSQIAQQQPSQIAQQQPPTGNERQSRTTKRGKISNPNPLTPINEEPASALPYISPPPPPTPSPGAISIDRKSFSAAASDLAPKFPLPPMRTPHKANRESIVSDGLIKQPPSVVARTSNQPRPATQLRLPPQRDRPPTIAAPLPPPHTPNSAVPSASSPLPIPQSSRLTSASDGANMLQIRSSMAPIGRSSSTRSALSTRTARGVRFDLELPSSDTLEVGPPSMASPRSALRIPGTRFSIPIPFAAPATPRPVKRESTLSSSDMDYESEGDIANSRPESLATLSSPGSDLLESRPHLLARDSSGELDPGLGPRQPVASRPKSMSVLGGHYLDSDDELQAIRSRRRASSSSTLDTRSSASSQ